MCLVMIFLTAAVSGTFAAGMLLLVQVGARANVEPIFPADQRDALLPLDRNGNPNAF